MRPLVTTLLGSIAVIYGGCSHSSPTEDPAPYDPHTAAGDCEGCHPTHVREWRISPHAYAMADPVFHTMVRIGQAQTAGKLDQFCTRCHSPVGVETNQTAVSIDEATGRYTQKTEGLDVAAMSGVSCESCHSMVDVTRRNNGGFVLNRDGVKRATVEKPIATSAHGTQFSLLHASSDMCGSCHMVLNPLVTRTVAIEETFSEWSQSVFPGQKECQHCHMPEYSGPAARGGPERSVHRHTFVGVDVSLVPESAFPGYEEQRALSRELLQNSAELSAVALVSERRLRVTVRNLAGHSLPSGAVADREMWIEVKVRNAGGQIVFESGTLDERGDLRVSDPARTTRPGTDPQLALYTQWMYFDPALETPQGTGERRQVDFLWEPNTIRNHLINASDRDEHDYDLAGLGAGSYVADVRLLFRSFPPHLLRRLEHEAGLSTDIAPRVPTVEMETTSVTWDMP